MVLRRHGNPRHRLGRPPMAILRQLPPHTALLALRGVSHEQLHASRHRTSLGFWKLDDHLKAQDRAFISTLPQARTRAIRPTHVHHGLHSCIGRRLTRRIPLLREVTILEGATERETLVFPAFRVCSLDIQGPHQVKSSSREHLHSDTCQRPFEVISQSCFARAIRRKV
jgi:hypothetical protein